MLMIQLLGSMCGPTKCLTVVRVIRLMLTSSHYLFSSEVDRSFPKGNFIHFTLILKLITTFYRERVRRAAVLAVNDPITLQIFLNSKQEAIGSLYLDDGQSYDYRTKNAFISGNFSFIKRTLNYEFKSGTPDANPAWLERVVIYGYPSKPNRIVAQLGSDQSKATQIAFKYNADTKEIVIRKPSLPFGQNWQVQIF